MQPNPLSPIRKAWYKWKSLHLPWRKRFLIGLDLQNNTFWEFRDTLSSHQHRMRRIVQYPPSTHLSEVRISPQWHQWLRHTRADPPSLREQSEDIVRQERLKVLAADADRRWAAKPSFLDRPRERRPVLEGAGQGGVQRMEGRGGSVGGVGVGGEIGDGDGDGEGLKDAGRPQDAAGVVDARRPMPAVGNESEESNHEKSPLNERQEGRMVKEKKYKEDPWKQARGAPSEEWRPQAWSPNAAATKR